MEDAVAQSSTVDIFGRIIVTGYASNGSQREFAIARLKSDGSMEPTFHGDGRRTVGGFGGGQRAVAVGSGVFYAGDVGDIVVGGWAEVAEADPVKNDPYRWAIERLDWNEALNAGVTIHSNSVVMTDLPDFPFATDSQPLPFPGFDPKSGPARVDVEMEFKEVAQAVVFSGAVVRSFERNENTFRFSLLNWPGSEPVQIHVSQSHHFGQNHMGNPGQRYALDMILHDPDRNSHRRTAASMTNTVEQLAVKWSSAPGFDPDAEYGFGSFNEYALIYGLPVVAMAAGEVVFAENGDPENFPVGTRDPASGGGGSAVGSGGQQRILHRPPPALPRDAVLSQPRFQG
jgi:hypothetical protein